MADLGKNLKKRGAKAVRDLYHEAETRVLVAEGRKAVRRKAQLATAITNAARKKEERWAGELIFEEEV